MWYLLHSLGIRLQEGILLGVVEHFSALFIEQRGLNRRGPDIRAQKYW